MEDLLAGLQFSHERGVVHRDIKPANVMLTGTGQAKIADFGIARIESSSMTQAGTVLGTPAYMSPEQFMGQVVDARTDIYSSGVLLYQLLTGERPFEGGMSAIMHKALNTEPPAPSQLSVTAPPSFDAVVRRAMAKRPEDRLPRRPRPSPRRSGPRCPASAEPASQDEVTHGPQAARPRAGTAGVAAASASVSVPASAAGRLPVPMMAAGGGRCCLRCWAAPDGGSCRARRRQFKRRSQRRRRPVPAADMPPPKPESRPAAPPADTSQVDRTPPPAPSATPSPPTVGTGAVPAPVAAPPASAAGDHRSSATAAGLDVMRRQIAQWVEQPELRPAGR